VKTLSLGTSIVSATRSVRREIGGAAVFEQCARQRIQRHRAASAALSTVTRIGSVDTTLTPCFARTGPMSSAPGSGTQLQLAHRRPESSRAPPVIATSSCRGCHDPQSR